jgi:hypothetical protein
MFFVIVSIRARSAVSEDEAIRMLRKTLSSAMLGSPVR